VIAKSYQRHYREVVHDTPEWIRPPASARKVLARIYEITCVLNGVATVEYEMTTRSRSDAVQRLKARYRHVDGVEIETGPVKPLAFAEADLAGARQISASCRMAPTPSAESVPADGDAPTRESAGWHARELDYDENWAKPFAAAARRIAAGKTLDARELAGAPPRLLAGWPFLHARKVLRQDKGNGLAIAGDDERQGWSSLLPWSFVKDLPNLLIRMKALGYLTQSGTTWRVTAKGEEARRRSQGRITRAAAFRAIERLTRRIKEINENQSYCYSIDVAVIFGSALDPEKDRVGDVDLAYRLAPRVVDKNQFETMREAKIASCPAAQARRWYGRISWPEDEVLHALTSVARGVVETRRIDELEALFEDEHGKPSYRVLHGSWTPPRKGRTESRA